MQNLLSHNINSKDLIKELVFRATRSSGKGGQNVNKVSTKVILIFNLEKSNVLGENTKSIIKDRLCNRISKQGNIQLTASKERSQQMNKSAVIKKFLSLINDALESEELRIITKPTKISINKRLAKKAAHSLKKQIRRTKFISEE